MQTTEDMPPNYVSIYIQVDDIQACLDKAESLGGKTIVPPTPVSRVVWDTSVCLLTLPETTSVCLSSESLLLWRGFRWDNS